MLEERVDRQDGGESAPEAAAEREPVTAPFAEPAPARAPEPAVEELPVDEPADDAEAEAPAAEAEPAPEADAEDGADATIAEEPKNPKLKWYVVHTYSGHENKVRTNLLKRIQSEDLQDKFGQVLVPTEEVTEMKKGRKTVVNRKYFPSYLLVEMEMCDEAYHLVNSISGVTRFVGLDTRDPNTRPVPLRPQEVGRILGRIEQPIVHRVTEIPYQVGDHVRVIDGPFSDFNGVVNDVNTERGTLKVMVTIFGRETPVELDFLQVEPI
jgi:transcriptional antiterminator NusG